MVPGVHPGDARLTEGGHVKYTITLLVALFASSAMAETVWEWDAPTEREDGTALTVDELADYEIACGRTSPDELYIGSADGEATSTSIDMSAALPSFGRYDCVIRVSDTDGLVSGWSESVRYVHNAAPRAPGRLRFR